jgi:hypothetical protein
MQPGDLLQWLGNIGEKHIQQFAQFGNFCEQFAWTVADRYMPEAREGYPYVMWGQLVNVLPGTANNAFPANVFANPTADELVIDYFRIECAPDMAGAVIAGGGAAGSYQGFYDNIIRVTVKDLAHNAPLMQQSVPVGLLIEHNRRIWTPTRRIILPGNSQSNLQVLVDNVSAATTVPFVNFAAHCHARTRKNTPQ